MSSPRTATPAALRFDAVREAYLAALLEPDPRAAWAAVDDALRDGMDPRDAYLRVVAPAMVEIGALWEAARISVAREHLATQVTQTVLARLAPRLEGPSPVRARRLAVVAGTPGEQHAIGARMVADFLEPAGWDVLLCGPDTPDADVVALAAERRPELVALSTALPGNLLSAGRLMAALHRLEPPPLVAAGGRAYDGDERRAHAAGADLFAGDPGELLVELEQVPSTGA